MSGTRAIPEEELPFPPERIEHRDPENIDPADAEQQPETQGDEPQEADLGTDGQGDLAPEDDPDVLADDMRRENTEPTDLRDEEP